MVPSPRIQQYSRSQAERDAFRLIAYASAVLPDIGGDTGRVVIDDLLGTGIRFAVNARRCLELGEGDREICSRRWDYDLAEGITLETSLKRALNGIIHAKDLRIHHVDAPGPVFKDHTNSLCLHFVYETDRYPTTYVDIFGMCWAFVSLQSE